jgi:outer membrane protein TolC
MHKFSKTMKIIRSILLLAVGFGTLPAQAQLTIDACQQKAQANYPLVAQYGLIRQSEQYDLENANKGYLPQLSLSAKASYQTDVPKFHENRTPPIANALNLSCSMFSPGLP